METLNLNVESRTETGKGAMKRLRSSGLIPGVVYSEGKEAHPVSLVEREYLRVVEGKSSTQLFEFTSNVEALKGVLVLVKDVQREPIKDKIVHVDFLSLHAGHRVTLTVHIEFVGESQAVKQGAAILNISAHEIEIECLPREIPEKVIVDISKLAVGDSVHASDIALPEGVVLKSDPKLNIVSAIEPKEEEVKPVVEAAAAPVAAAEPAKTES